mgnify:CR=1 FL=1
MQVSIRSFSFLESDRRKGIELSLLVKCERLLLRKIWKTFNLI